MWSGAEKTKVGECKTMQNPLVNAPNGAICCKLWPQTVLGWGPQILGGNPFLLGSPSAPWAGYEGFKVALGYNWVAWGPLRGWVSFGNPFSENMLQNHCILRCLRAGEVHRSGRTKAGSSGPGFNAPEVRMTVVRLHRLPQMVPLPPHRIRCNPILCSSYSRT